MYQPPHFREDRREVQHALIRAHPLGLLVSAGPSGLMANPIPFVIEAAGPLGTLRGHLARANGQWRDLAAVEECLVVFQGPHDYITPAWYATKQETGKVVPTWNYAMVQAWGRPCVREDAAWLTSQVTDLTDEREAARKDAWAVADAPEAYIAGQIRGIVGIEIAIGRIEGKWKVSQNRSAADRDGVVQGLDRDGRTAMASLVSERSGPRG